MATLRRNAMEYFWWEIDGLPADAQTVEVNLEGAWWPLQHHDDTWRILLAGPDVAGQLPAGAVRITTRWQSALIRVPYTPETIIVPAGPVVLQA
jgi:hypothetical protein